MQPSAEQPPATGAPGTFGQPRAVDARARFQIPVIPATFFADDLNMKSAGSATLPSRLRASCSEHALLRVLYHQRRETRSASRCGMPPPCRPRCPSPETSPEIITDLPPTLQALARRSGLRSRPHLPLPQMPATMLTFAHARRGTSCRPAAPAPHKAEHFLWFPAWRSLPKIVGKHCRRP